MRTLLLAFLLVAAILFTDLAASYVFALSGDEASAFVRRAREVLLIGTALGGAACTLRAGRISTADWFAAGYAALTIAYLAAYFLTGFGFDGAVASAGILLLPVILVLCGRALHASGASRNDLTAAILLCATASALFGLWEIHATDFWTDVVRLPDYLKWVKGVEVGFEPETGLPWNFFRAHEERRAAGLLAAPLAQGPVLVIAAALCLSVSTGWRWLRFGLAAFLLYGAAQSGTRAAIVTFLLFASFAAAMASERKVAFIVAAGLLWAGAIFVFGERISQAVELTDGSTIGHVRGLESSVQDLHHVLVTGAGLGSQGTIAGQEGRISLGGGESAFFSVVYQIGLPGGLLFGLFYAALLVELWRGPEARGRERRLVALLGLAMAVNLIISDYLLSLSGAGVLWVLLGYFVAEGQRDDHDDAARAPDETRAVAE